MRRLGFRGRLLAGIAAVLIVGGAVLLLVQYIVLQHLLSSASSALIRDIGQAPSQGVGELTGQRWLTDSQNLPGILAQVQLLAGGLLVAFTILGLCVAVVTVRRATRQVGAIAATAERISDSDLSRRLPVTGPDDELRQLTTVMNGMLDRLEEAFKRQASFVASAAHELRTPIATVRTIIQIAERQGRIPDDLADDMRAVLDANHRLERLIAALLEIARSQNDQGLPQSQVDFTALVDDAVNQARDEAAGGVSLDWERPASPIIVLGIPEVLRSAVDNLINNAVRHNRPDGWVHVKLEPAHEKVRLRVTNSGDGSLTPELIAGLTAPFNRGTRTRLGGDAGLGLGLTLVETVLSRHGGTLELAGGDDGGLEVVATIPVTAQ